MRYGVLLAGLVMVGGCSAGALPIEQPPTVTTTLNDITESEFLAVGMVVRDAVALVVPKLLAAPPGLFDPQTKTRDSGTLTISGIVDVPEPRAATFAVAVAVDEYQPPQFSSVQKYSDWLFSNGAGGPPAMTLSFTDMPTKPLESLGEINGTFVGGLSVLDGKLPGDLDVRLNLQGQLVDDVNGKVAFRLLHVSGVIMSPQFGSYQNDVPYEPADGIPGF